MKNFLEWRNEWSLGIEVIDQHHRQLAVMFNKIIELYLSNDDQTDSGQRSNQLHEQLNIFYEKIKEHFNEEEDLMLKTNYPGHTNHAREHLMLLAELKHYIRQIDEELDNISTETLSSLKVWFISHITGPDKELADFLKACSQDEPPSLHTVNS